MLSASHNPAPDNGIKFFARGGVKLPDSVEDEIEARLAAGHGGAAGNGTAPGPSGVPEGGFGRVRDAADQGERYLDYLLSTVTSPAAAASCRWPGCGSSWTARTARRPGSRPACCAGRARRSSRSARSLTGSTSTRAAGLRTWTC